MRTLYVVAIAVYLVALSTPSVNARNTRSSKRSGKSSKEHIDTKDWTPQLGTVHYPKHSGRWPFARAGDVVHIDGQLFVAKSHVDLKRNHRIQPTQLMPLPKGSFRRPLDFNNDRIETVGQLFYDIENDMFYIAICVGPTGMCLSEMNVEENWMSLIRDHIGHKRLSELFIVGSHDAGTRGITTGSFLIPQSLDSITFFNLFPQIMVDLAITQGDDLLSQLQKGSRYLDLRITDAALFGDTNFYWWHTLTADRIEQGLHQCASFATDHRNEVIILDLTNSQSFATPGNEVDPFLTMSVAQLDAVASILLTILGPVLVSESAVGNSNPTVNEILATGRNVIALVGNDYIRDKSDLFWTNILITDFEGKENPEDLFNERSEKLQLFSTNNLDDVTKVSGALTTANKILGGIISKVVENGPLDWSNVALQNLIRARLEFPVLPVFSIQFDHTRMSFEGVFNDLISMARLGTNTAGMTVRDVTRYSNGQSVHYKGTNDMIRYWAARSNKFKPSIYNLDDVSVSSTAVRTSIKANMGDVKREVSIVHQGTPTNGHYKFVNDESGVPIVLVCVTEGGEDAFNCDTVRVAIEITSRKHKTIWREFSSPIEIIFKEGEYPFDSKVSLFVALRNTTFAKIFSSKIQDMITANDDIYVRGTDNNGSTGFAYVSRNYALFNTASPLCTAAPDSGFIAAKIWH